MAYTSYTPTNWQNAPDHKTTPLSADNLNHMEGGIADSYKFDNMGTDLSSTNKEAAIKEVYGKSAKSADLTSISESGTTASQAISAGTYFYLNGTLVRAKTAIANGATFTENTNYEVTTIGDAINGSYVVSDGVNLNTYSSISNYYTVPSAGIIIGNNGCIVYTIDKGGSSVTILATTANLLVTIFVKKGLKIYCTKNNGNCIYRPYELV